MTFRSRTVTAVAALTLTLGVAACGADEKPQVTGTSTKPSTTAPADPAQGNHLTQASFLPALKSGMADKKSVRTTTRLTVAGQTSTLTGVQTMADPPAASIEMTSPAGGGKTRVLVVKNMVYLSMPGTTPAGKYLKIDPKDPTNPYAQQMGGMLDAMDLSKTFKPFDAGLTNVRHVGTETVAGVRADRYKVTVDMAKALAAQGQPAPAGMPKAVTYDMWMDKADLVRRLSFQMPNFRMVMNMSDWGKPVTIKAPPASAIISR